MSDSIKTTKALCRWYMYADIPTYLHGMPGVGKSSAIVQLANEEKIGFIDVRASTMLPEDLNGIPVPDLVRRLAVWLKNEVFPVPERDGERGIILFDELSDAGKNIQSGLYRVILDRLNIPKGWWPCAAGNRRQDRAAAQALSTALANRFAHIDVEPDVDAFIEWALNTEHMGHMVPGFIKARPNLLHSMEGADLRAFPTPRSWEQVAKVLNTGVREEFRMKLVSGLVGEGAAGELEAFLNTIDLPDFEEVLAAPEKCRIPKEPGHKYAMSCMLARYIKRNNFDKVMKYIKRSEFGRDFEICTVLEATKRDVALCETAAYADFGTRNAELKL